MSAPLPAGYDMHDDDVSRWPRLAFALNLCEKLIRPVYDEADANALWRQRRHRLVANIVVVCGTFAILSAFVDAARVVDAPWPSWLELLGVLVALATVGLGSLLRFHKQWLIQRNKAERCRFLKFRFLIQPALWSKDPAAVQRCTTELEKSVQELRALSQVQQLEDWAATEQLMELLPIQEEDTAGIDVVPELTEYYRAKRIVYQLKFLDRRIERNEQWNRWTAGWPFWLFFGSIFFALLHFVSRYFGAHVESASVRWLIFLAAGLPALSAGVSALRAANQFARNRRRYEHCRDALRKLDALLSAPAAAALRFRDFVICETKLEAEHRNWLHLMTEAEWF